MNCGGVPPTAAVRPFGGAARPKSLPDITNPVQFAPARFRRRQRGGRRSGLKGLVIVAFSPTRTAKISENKEKGFGLGITHQKQVLKAFRRERRPGTLA